MIFSSISTFQRRPGVTITGIFSLAAASVLLLCGAGSVPVENFSPQGPMQSDLNAGGHNMTNAATVNATNFVGGGAGLTGLNGTNVTAGTVPPSALGFSTAPYNLFTGPFPAGTKGFYVQKGTALAAGATADVLPTVTGSGYVSSIFAYLFNSDSAGSLVNVYLDGSSTASISCPLQDLVAGDGGLKSGRNSVAGPYFTWQGGGLTGFGGSLKLAIPFKTSIHITITNGSASASSLYVTAEYQTGVPVTSIPLTEKLFASYQNTAAAAPNSVVTLVNATGLNPGQLAGFYLSLDGTNANSPGFLEGYISVYIDGGTTPIYQSSGTEDAIEMPNYFAGFPSNICDPVRGLLYNNTVNDNIFQLYKMWSRGPITFNNAVRITWDAGESSSYAGTVNVKSTTFFYTQ